MAARGRSRTIAAATAAAFGRTSVEEGGRFPVDPPMDFEVLLDVPMRGYRA
ncbi:hypothetical protein ACFZBU_10340 [Embleya sp. NPDC008237]|uniref:hypothetical protein n=1 Tax=Embleya sp. NPDC008237 TaxID=3363978 RepID=UPI0036E3EC38